MVRFIDRGLKWKGQQIRVVVSNLWWKVHFGPQSFRIINLIMVGNNGCFKTHVSFKLIKTYKSQPKILRKSDGQEMKFKI
jgi:hypothetical protein